MWTANEGLQGAFGSCISTPRAAPTVQVPLLFLILVCTEGLKHSTWELQCNTFHFTVLRQVKGTALKGFQRTFSPLDFSSSGIIFYFRNIRISLF